MAYPPITGDHEAYENMLALQDRMGEMQEQMNAMQRQIDILSSSDQLQRELESTEDDGYESGGIQKYEESVDEYALIDQIPPAESPKPRQKHLAYVLIDNQRDEAEMQRRNASRKQPIRESTLKAPRTSIEQSHRVTGKVWSDKELKKLGKGLHMGLSDQEIHLRYLPNRTPEGIRKKRAKLQQKK